jgi:hypothetical protein
VVAAGGVEIIRFEPDLLGPLADFYRLVWDPIATAEGLGQARARRAAENLADPGVEVPTWLFLKGGRVLGHVSTLPVQVWDGRAIRPAYWFVGLMVVPEHRNGPVGFLLMREAAKGLELTLSLSVQDAAVRLFRGVGFTELGVIPNYVRALRPGTMIRRLDPGALGLRKLPHPLAAGLRLRKLPGVAALAGLGVTSALAGWSWWHTPRRSARELVWRPAAVPERSAIDGLWSCVSGRIQCCVVRDAAYVNWRYNLGDSSKYRSGALYQGGDLVGLAVVRAPRDQGDPRLRGIRLATMSDLLFDPARPEIGLRLLQGAEHIAHDFGADAVLASASHAAIRPLLRSRGYLRFGGNLHFLVRDATGALPGNARLRNWWLLRGDADADHVF